MDLAKASRVGRRFRSKADDNTTYAAGPGLALTGNAFSVDTTATQTRVTGNCPVGQAIRAIDPNGQVSCEVDDNSGGDLTGVTGNTQIVVANGAGPVPALSIGGASIDSAHLAPGAVGVSQLADDAVVTSKIAPDAVGSSEIDDGAIANVDISSTAAITPSKISGTAAVTNFSSPQSFDSGLLYLDPTSNEVGINDTSPSYALDVNGTTASSEYRWRTPRTFHRWVMPKDFQSESAQWSLIEWHSDFWFPETTAGVDLYAPLHLPDGADMTRITCYYYDSTPTAQLEDLIVYLYTRAELAATAVAINTSVFSPLNTTWTTLNTATDSSISGAGDPVDNAGYTYTLRVHLDLPAASTPSQGIRFYGCRVRYVMTTIGL